MQGFFGKPVDNLFAEPFIARWIRLNVPHWKEAVVVSKNAGGTKRVTSLADTLKLNFGIVTTDRRRPKTALAMSDSTVFFDSIEHDSPNRAKRQPQVTSSHKDEHGDQYRSSVSEDAQSELTDNAESFVSENALRPETPPAARRPSELEAENPYTDVRAKDVITGRLVQGHIVDDDYPSSSHASVAASGRETPLAGLGRESAEALPDAMINSFISTTSSVQPEHALGGSGDAVDSSDEESSAGHGSEQEKMITLVGEVRDRTVFIVDDMIDKSGSWIAAAETVVKRGGAKKVYCIATHGLFGDDSLDQMEACESIDYIVVTNTFPISQRRMRRSKKLVVIDISNLLAESIRRHHYGERFVPAMRIPV